MSWDDWPEEHTFGEAAAMLRKMAEQKPVGEVVGAATFSGVSSNPTINNKVSWSVDLPFGTKVYAAPVAAITAEQRTQDAASLSQGPTLDTPKADNPTGPSEGCGVPAIDVDEAMRLHRQAMIASYFHVTEDADRGTAALAAYLKGQR